jgi:uncharacterized protein YndB with AHSA1/START domain
VLKWALYALLALGGLVAVVALIGWSLPVAHSASGTATLAAPPEAVFALISDFARYPDWQPGVSRVEVSGAPGAGQGVVMHGRSGTVPYHVEVFDPPRRIVTRIDRSERAFGGTWTYELRPVATGTELTITEDGEVYNLIFRTLARFVFGHTATIDAYLHDLERQFIVR